MKNSAKLLSHLRMFEGNRQGRKADLKKATSRKEYAEVIADCFIPCAQAIFAGHFCVKNDDGKVIRKIYPTVLELYYHEEKEDGFKDPIMYHTNDRKYYDYYLGKRGELKEHSKKSQEDFEKRCKYELPYFPFCSLNPHTSGIDITFENPDKKYRASCLIREYDFYYFDEDEKIECPNSTFIYDDMLINGIPLDNNDRLVWEDNKDDENVKGQTLDAEDYIEKHCISRKNVPAYELADVHPEDKNCPKLWRKKIKAYGNQSGDIKYEPCTFPWQFRKKEK